MLDKLAIVIVGEQCSGKTSTLRVYSDYYVKEVGSFKKGWRYGLTPFKPQFWAIKVFTYILPASPTETKIPLSLSIEPKNDEEWFPELLLMAEQFNGGEYPNTIHYLMKNEYHIKEYFISDTIGNGIWDRWNEDDEFRKDSKLMQRREEIAKYIREFIVSKVVT